jgi:demethylmenaquinone methyltransferase / 2-methoxy-6-polyprenyl-1,4-benzoquinol methylase
MPPPPMATREAAREERFNTVWSQQLNAVFADVAPYYDRANDVATLGLCNWLRRRFLSQIVLEPGLKVLDVCAGTNAIGIGLLEREPRLEVHAMDRSQAMQDVGRERAAAKGLRISSVIGDVHSLPFPDNHFDIVTLQFASRHLGVKRVFSEIHRVLKPGGHFHHCDMLRPANPVVEQLYYAYLRFCVAFTAFVFGCGPDALGCKKYFIDALQNFYSAEELSILMQELGYRNVEVKTVLAGMMAFHSAVKPRSIGARRAPLSFG